VACSRFRIWNGFEAAVAVLVHRFSMKEEEDTLAWRHGGIAGVGLDYHRKGPEMTNFCVWGRARAAEDGEAGQNFGHPSSSTSPRIRMEF
jgi:hypothetical protein